MSEPIIIKLETNSPFKLEGKEIDHFLLRPIKFRKYCDIRRVSFISKEPSILMSRLLLIEYASAITSSGETIALDAKSILLIPRNYSKKIVSLMFSNIGVAGEVVQNSKNIDMAAIYKLGTPINVKSGETTNQIIELEFIAKTYGDVEKVITEDDEVRQGLAFIESCASPLGSDLSLMSLPEWAVDEISLADGLAITNEVLPSFLE